MKKILYLRFMYKKMEPKNYQTIKLMKVAI